MRAKFEITFNLDKKPAVIEFLRKNRVTIRSGNRFHQSQVTGSWKNLNNPNNFKFTLNDWPIVPWWGKCSLIPMEDEHRTTLKVVLLPSYLVMIFLGIMAILFIHTIISFGQYNYGKSGFLLSITLPFIMVGTVVVFWFIIWGYFGRKV